jgi:sirohydrochlorin cobaltochelatase
MDIRDLETGTNNSAGANARLRVLWPLAPDPWSLTDAVLLVGHGTRDAAGVAEFLLLAERVRGLMTPRPLEACFLELAQPTIADGLKRLIDRRAERIAVVPLLLTAAGHAKRDIPCAIAEVSAAHPDLIIRQTAALDCHPRIVDLSTRRYDEALVGRLTVPPEETLLLLVGRGSSDAGAVATVRRFAELRAERSQVGRVETCFAAVAKPSLDEILPIVAASGFPRIVVQPHLLFRGRLLADVREGAARFETGETAIAGRCPTEWVVTGPLGPEPELADSVVDLVRALDGLVA